jgi:LCP family protein required for cell wall assembly
VLTDALSAALVPGWNARRRSAALAMVLVALGWGVPLVVAGWAVASRRTWVALTLDQGFLRLVTAALVAALAARLVALAEVWVAHGRPGDVSWRNGGALGVVVIVALPLAVGTVSVARARVDLAPVFAGQLDAPLWSTVDGTPNHPQVIVPALDVGAREPSPDAASPEADSAAAVAGPVKRAAGKEPRVVTPAPPPARPSAGIDSADRADVTTILLLGGDAGPGRWSLRTDTMMLFSVHRPSGRAALISVPRNLMRLLFPPDSALGTEYPQGFTDLANAVYPIVQSRPALRDAYQVPGVDAGVVALAQGLGYSLDVTIDDYVLVDMRGFVGLVDAIGGVTVDVPKAVPMPGNIPDAPTQYPDVLGPGVIHMDGTTALGYARSRYADSDYHRAARQRALLAALGQQVSAGDVLGSYGAVAAALGASLRTSLTPDELADTLAVIGGVTAIVESVGLVPPVVNVNNPDWNQLARIVGEVQVALTSGRPSGW